jgi:hypothetical protein
MSCRINKFLFLLSALTCCAFLALDAQVLKGRVMYGTAAARGVKVVLAPNNSSNEMIISYPRFLGDDISQLRKMNAVVALTNNDGYYYFSNIRSGRWMIKVCVQQGTVYKFILLNDRYTIQLIPDLRASPGR